LPKFPGGEQELCRYIVKNTDYPKREIDKNISGKVYVNFMVEKTGKVTQVRIIRGVSPGLDSAALKVVSSMPNWIPAKSNGTNIAAQYTLPIQFSLTDGGKPDIKQCDSYGKQK
jgi:TonB family protein